MVTVVVSRVTESAPLPSLSDSIVLVPLRITWSASSWVFSRPIVLVPEAAIVSLPAPPRKVALPALWAPRELRVIESAPAPASTLTLSELVSSNWRLWCRYHPGQGQWAFGVSWIWMLSATVDAVVTTPVLETTKVAIGGRETRVNL